MDEPIIKEILTQRCVGYREHFNGGTVSIIQNVGLDENGGRWTWKSETVSRMDDNGYWHLSFGSTYEWVRVG